MSILILASGLKDVVYYGFFKIKQTNISKSLCINKDKPYKKCNGKCFLAKKLAEENKKQGMPSSSHREEWDFLFSLPVERLMGSDLSLSTFKSSFLFLTPLQTENTFRNFQPPDC